MPKMQKFSAVITATGGSRASQDKKSRTRAQEITFQELKTFRADGKSVNLILFNLFRYKTFKSYN